MALNIIYRSSKGSSLTPLELDNNFRELDTKKVGLSPTSTYAILPSGNDTKPTLSPGLLRLNTVVNNLEGYTGQTTTPEWRTFGQVGYTGSRAYTYGGSVGSTGIQGSASPTGLLGAVGYTGSVGPTGYTGSRGYTGSEGYIGSRGYRGSLGLTGNVGVTGPVGPDGGIPTNSSQYSQLTLNRTLSTATYYTIPVGNTVTGGSPGLTSTNTGLDINSLGIVTSSTSATNLTVHRRRNTSGVSYKFMQFKYNNTTLSNVSYSTTGGGFYVVSGYLDFANTSDYRIKTNIRPIKNVLNTLDKIDIYDFNYIGRENKQIGYIAHELQEYFPSCVSGKKDEVDNDNKPIYQAIDYIPMVPILIAAINELSEKIRAIKLCLQ